MRTPCTMILLVAKPHKTPSQTSFSMILLNSCGQQKKEARVRNAHNTFENHRWSLNSFPLIITVDQNLFAVNSQERMALDFSAYSWNRALEFEAIIIQYEDIETIDDYVNLGDFAKDNMFTTSEPVLSDDTFIGGTTVTLAITAYTFIVETKEIRHADIVFNKDANLSASTESYTYFDLESVYIHELGHFLAARRAGILCHEFSLGMGPVLWSKRVGETVYAVRAIPLGGYVAMAGEEVDDETQGKVGREL